MILDVGKTMEKHGKTWGLTYKPGWESWLSCRKSQSLILCFGTLKMLRHFVELDGETQTFWFIVQVISVSSLTEITCVCNTLYTQHVYIYIHLWYTGVLYI